MIDDADEAEMTRLMEQMGRRFILASVGAFVVVVAAGAVAYEGSRSLTLALIVAFGTLFVLTVDVFECETHAEYVTDAPIETVRAEFGGLRPPILYANWYDVDDVTTAGDTVTYVTETDDHSDDVYHRVTELSAELISGQIDTPDREILSWTVRMSSQADGTSLFITGRHIGGQSLVSLAGLYFAGSFEPEVMELMGYRYVDGSETISLQSPSDH